VAPPAGDQRGRPRVSFGRADIGASESDQVQATAILVNGGAAQRSMVTSITVRFNSLVTFAGSSVGAFQLTRTGPGGPTGAVTIAVDLSGSTATRTVAHLTFGGALAASGSLTDGTYALTVLSSQVSAGGRALDGDGDGVAGGDSVASLFRFFGDVNGDGFVNGADFAVFRTNFGGSI
jgi:hypothetical protein